jgi:hypothetical protein
MHDIKATSAFLKKKGFKHIMYWAEFDGMLATDGKTRSSLLFPVNMSLEEAEKKIIMHRKLFGTSDNVGTEEYNQKLSERRAKAVADYQKGLIVGGPRIFIIGLGELNSIASNDTDYGRQQKRRVEVAIFANEKLKKAAENDNLS